MHIPDGLLEPEICLATGLASSAAIIYSLKQVNQQRDDSLIPLTGVTAAMIFAAQMVNFPLFFVPVSGHLMGGVLAAILLGPWAGCLAMSLVVLVQCLLFADGGLLSLGANLLHMAVLGTWGGYFVYSGVQRFFAQKQVGMMVGAAVASWLSVTTAAVLFSLEMKWSLSAEEFSFNNFLMMMMFLHILIGLGEALITTLVLVTLRKQAPKVLNRITTKNSLAPKSRKQVLTTGLVCSLMVACFLAPCAASFPDGLEASVEASQLSHLEQASTGLFLSDYEIPWISQFSVPVSVAIAGVLGTSLVFILSLLFGRFLLMRSATLGASTNRD